MAASKAGSITTKFISSCFRFMPRRANATWSPTIMFIRSCPSVTATTDEEIEAALEEARNAPEEPLIIEAAYRPEPGLEFLMLRLSDGRRLLIPREELDELKNATAG